MPNIPKQTRGSETARAWAKRRAEQMGAAVQAARNEAEMSAVALSEKTAELGYPITRGTIAKIESGNRDGKFDISELLVLAFALEISPLKILIPLSEKSWEHLPGREVDNMTAITMMIMTPEAEKVQQRLRLVESFRNLREELTDSNFKDKSESAMAERMARTLSLGSTSRALKANWEEMWELGLIEGEDPLSREYESIIDKVDSVRNEIAHGKNGAG